MSTNVYSYEAGLSNWSRSIEDLRDGWRRRSQPVKVRPIWLTVTTAMTATGLAVLYGYLFARPLDQHLPYVTCAILSWALITGLANGGCTVFAGNSHIFKEFPLPASLFAYRLVLMQLITTAYRAIVLVGVILIFSVPLKPTALLSFLGLALILWTGFWSSLFLGVINARYRDFGQLVSAFFTFAFFLTPIFWIPERLGKYAFYVNFNPFYHLIEVIRGPILQHPNLGLHFAVAFGFAIVTPIIAIFVYGRLSHRLPYWC